MKFHFDTLVLWLKNKRIRTIDFLPNKINVITGDSNTGKTAILDIIDYCLFTSHHKISDSIINENVEWYGIKFTINEKCYTIARQAPSGNDVSREYYFSSIGEIPDIFPNANITESALKTSLESDFRIDRDVKFSYGGKSIKANSKISLRYFLLMNTISQDIITHSEEFFDKQKDEKYREALPRTFDLAVGIDTVENIIKREKHDEIEREIRKLKRESERLDRGQDAFRSQLSNIVKTAKEYSLVSEDTDTENAVLQLKNMVARAEVQTGMTIPEKYERISFEINEVERKIKNLQRFSAEYKKYKENLKITNDSLKPVEFLGEHFSEIIKTSIYNEMISSLKEDCAKIKSAIVSKTPLDSNISDLVKEYEDKLKALSKQRESVPEEVKKFESDRFKFMFIGETKAKLDLYEDKKDADRNTRENKISTLESELSEINVTSIEDHRELFVKTLDETIQDFIIETRAALENYGDYRSSFNYKEKRLQLRKPKTDFIENIGSSSNHMFLHLFLFLGLHEIIIRKKVPYVPPFLIIDQFSRPYWGEDGKRKETMDHTDISKVKSALKLLNNFVQRINEMGENFQMIIFEHINQELWEELPHVHLVEEFRDGNALIPKTWLKETQTEN